MDNTITFIFQYILFFKAQEDKMELFGNIETYTVYQPKINLKTLDIVGVEALIRFVDPQTNKTLNTETIIDSIEKIEDMIELTNSMIKTISFDIDKLRKINSNLNVSVNMSSKELCYINIDEWIMDRFADSKFHIDNFEIEITEKYEIKDTERMKRRIGILRDRGFKVSIDDIGSGFNDIDMVNTYDVDVIKIDKSMIRNFNNKSDELKYIINTTKKRSIKSLAEGIESEREYKQLLKLGCDFGQGYYFYRPMRIEELLKIDRVCKAS